MGDKKRKVVEEPAEEQIAPEGKKLKKDKKEKTAKVGKETVDVAPADVAPASDEVKQKKNKKDKYKEELREKRKEKKEKKKEKKETKEKKRKRNETDAEDDNKTEENSVFFIDTEGEKRNEKKERKDRKYNNNKKQKKTAEEETALQEEPVNQEETVNVNEAEAEDASQEKAARFICFVGNLPYSANNESVKQHFEKNPPAAVRVATKKEAPTKCRGFAFIEFDNYDRMKTALKLYHHSTFDDGKYPPRRINVELTAGGGGGNSEHRKAKIQAKNQKLNDERQRAAKQTQKDKRKHNKAAQSNGAPTGANAVGVDGANEDDQFAGVHPSRRRRMQ